MSSDAIRPYEGNRFYWEYRGQPTVLLGGSDQDNLFQWADEPDRLTRHFDTLVACGGNYLRNTMRWRYYHKYVTGNDPQFRWDFYPQPFLKLKDGRFDLTRWNALFLTELGQAHIRSARMLSEAVSVFSMAPHPELLSAREENEAYCLAEPGRQYAVYFTGAGDRAVELDLRAAGCRLEARWLEVARCAWGDPAPIDGGGRTRLSAPGAGQWAVVLKGGV